MEKLNETYHFKNDSKMSVASIQAGKLKNNPGMNLTASQKGRNPIIGSTNPAATTSFRGNFRTIGASESLTVDLAKPVIPDAMERIRQKQADKKQEKVD